MGQGGTNDPGAGSSTTLWGSNDDTKEIRKLRNPFFPVSLPKTRGSRGTLDKQDMGSEEDDEGSYTEVVSENERRGEGKERERDRETERRERTRQTHRQIHWL